MFLPKCASEVGRINSGLPLRLPRHLSRSSLEMQSVESPTYSFSSSERARNSTTKRPKLPLEKAADDHCPPRANLPLLGRGSAQTVPVMMANTWNSRLFFLLLKAGGSLPPGAFCTSHKVWIQMSQVGGQFWLEKFTDMHLLFLHLGEKSLTDSCVVCSKTARLDHLMVLC